MSEVKETLTVDEFVETKVKPELRPVVAWIRALMKACAPQAQELISYGIPAYKTRRIIAVISPTKKDITVSFSRGSQFEDTFDRLRGEGKSSKHIKIKEISPANEAALREYIRQALEKDAQ